MRNSLEISTHHSLACSYSRVADIRKKVVTIFYSQWALLKAFEILYYRHLAHLL